MRKTAKEKLSADKKNVNKKGYISNKLWIKYYKRIPTTQYDEEHK